MKYLETYRNTFLAYLEGNLQFSEPKNLFEPISYIMQLGGKRLRPILTLMTCDLYDVDYKKALDAALAIEIFHNFSLIHDDIMDEAPIRRGKETVHKKWDLNTGILSGDAMMMIAYQCFEKYDAVTFKKLAQLFSKTALEVCIGQQYDIDFESRNDVSIEEYVKMITYKTSVLVAAAMEMGAIIAEVSEEETAKIYQFGLNLGIAFQLQDDLLDTYGNQAEFGKQIGGDILENKKTYLYLKTYEMANENDQITLNYLYNQSKSSTEKINHVKKIFTKYNIKEITQQEVESYTQKAFSILNELNLSEEKKRQLIAFGNWLMKRKV